MSLFIYSIVYRSRGLPDGYNLTWWLLPLAFCIKMEGVLWQNAARFMAKRIPFPYKTLPVLIRNATTACYTDPTPNPSPGKGGEYLATPTTGSWASYYRFVSLLLPVREPLTTGSWASYYRFVTDELTGRGPTAVRISTFVFCKTFRHLSYFGSKWLKISSITQKQTIIFGHSRSC